MTRRILYVEDNERAALAIIRTLERKLSVEIDWARNLAQANAFLNTTKYGMWLVDWSLNGTIEVLLERPHPPTIAITGAGDVDGVRERLEALGCIAVLTKPPDFLELLAIVAQVLAGSFQA